MYLIKIEKTNGLHEVQSQSHREENWMGEGWAVVPLELEGKLIELYPFVVLTVKGGIVTSVEDDTVARKAWEASQVKTPAEQRKAAYATQASIPWEGEQITVDIANTLWVAYSVEGSATASQLSALIETAKQKIRAMYPDVAA